MKLKGREQGAAALLLICTAPIAAEALSVSEWHVPWAYTQALAADAAPHEVDGESEDFSGDTTLMVMAGALTSLGANSISTVSGAIIAENPWTGPPFKS